MMDSTETSWDGGFPSELVSDLKTAGFAPTDFSDYDDDDRQSLINFHSESGKDFHKNIEQLNKAFKLLPEDLREKYKDKMPELLSSAPLIADMAKLLKRFDAEAEQQAEQQENSIKFEGMDGLEREAGLRDIRDQLTKLIYQHDARLKGRYAREGRAKSW